MTSGLPSSAPSTPRGRIGLGGRYWRLWTATSFSNLGDGATLVAMPLLAASITQDPLTIAGVGVFTPLAKIVVSLGGGVLVDRADRRLVMLGADLARFAVMLVFAVLVLVGEIGFVAMYATIFALGLGEFLFDTAATAIVRDVVPPSRLTLANGWLFAAEDGAQDLAAPPLGAVLFSVANWLPFLVDAMTFAASAVLVVSLRGAFRAERPAGKRSVRRELRDGMSFVFRDRFFRSTAVMWVTLGFVLGATLATMVLFALDTLGTGELGFAAIITAGAVGVVAGNLLADRLERWIRPRGVLCGAVITSGLALIVTGAAPVLVVAAAAQVAWGMGFALANTQMVSLRQRLVSDGLLGRVTGVFGLMSAAGMVAGTLIGGALSDLGGPRVPIISAGVIQLIAGVVWFISLSGVAGARLTPVETSAA